MALRIRLLATQTAIILGVYALPLLFAAGPHLWPAGWVFVVIWFGFLLGLIGWLVRHNPALLQERMRLGAADQERWDKMLAPLINLAILAWMVFISFDAARFHWSPVPPSLQVIGGLLLLLSCLILFLTFRENPFLSPIVHIQEERGQHVISTGPYRHVRHPMYCAMVVFTVGVPLLLGSGYGVLTGLVVDLVVARRLVLEEQTLRRDLPGYAAYMEQVRYRLLPHVW